MFLHYVLILSLTLTSVTEVLSASSSDFSSECSELSTESSPLHDALLECDDFTFFLNGEVFDENINFCYQDPFLSLSIAPLVNGNWESSDISI